jgi:hypothetical protein
MATRAQKKLIDELVQHYRESIPEFKTFASVLRTQILDRETCESTSDLFAFELRIQTTFVRSSIES